jgi:hypothetical protein
MGCIPRVGNFVGLHEAVFDRKVGGNSCIPRVGNFVGLHEAVFDRKVGGNSCIFFSFFGLHELFLIEKSLEIAACWAA